MPPMPPIPTALPGLLPHERAFLLSSGETVVVTTTSTRDLHHVVVQIDVDVIDAQRATTDTLPSHMLSVPIAGLDALDMLVEQERTAAAVRAGHHLAAGRAAARLPPTVTPGAPVTRDRSAP